MKGVLRAIINVVPAGQRYAENVYQYPDGIIKGIISHLQSTRPTAKGRVFIIFYTLIGTTGWTVTGKAIENLDSSESKMVILVYEPGKKENKFMGIEEQLKHSINDQQFKINETYRILGKVVEESPIFIIRNEGNDQFDRNILRKTIEVLNSCAKHSHGSVDMIKLLEREEISRIQYLVPIPNINVDTISEEKEKIKELGLAEIVEPEALFATNVGGGVLRMFKRHLFSSGPEKFVIISFGLYKIKDEFLSKLLKSVAQQLISKIRERDPELVEKIQNLEPEVLERLERFEVDKKEVGKRLMLITRTLYGTPMPKKEEKEPQKDTSEYDKILENLAE
ncbi:MAG: hypothetical protein QW532_00265 [Archaeoglobaceae archaeon]